MSSAGIMHRWYFNSTVRPCRRRGSWSLSSRRSGGRSIKKN